MKFATFIVCTLLLLGSTVAAGVVHRRMTNSWRLSPTSRVAGERLKAFPAKDVGNWRFARQSEFSPAVLEILEQPAYVSRVYQHVQTGDTITVVVLVGQPGPVAVHTPEICYSSRDYAAAGSRQSETIAAADGRKHELWKLSLASQHVDQLPLEVLYGWTTGTHWEATDEPRYAFGGLSHLYKLQIAAMTRDSLNDARRSETEFDPVQDFLSGFLSQLQSHLVESRPQIAATN